MAQVSFADVKKVYPDGTVAVKDLTLDIPDGELMVFVGPSGCGKTTALRMVAGLEVITEGEVRIGDGVVNRLPPRDRDVAMVFQNYALYPHKTVYENLSFPLRLRRLEVEVDQRSNGWHRYSTSSNSCRAGRDSCRVASDSAWRWAGP